MKKCYAFLPKTWLRPGLSAAFVFSLALTAQAQTAPIKYWDKVIGGDDQDKPTVMHKTTDGGFILGGFSKSTLSGDKTQGSGYYDYWVVKLDANGTKVWDKTIGTSNLDILLDLQQTADGGYIMGGESYAGINGDKTEPQRGDSDYWIVKLDANGNKLWDKTLGGGTFDYFNSLQQTSDGGYILAGTSESSASGDKTQPAVGLTDYWIVKIDASGNKLWDKTFGGPLDDALLVVKQTPDGGYILSGLSESGIGGDKSQISQGSWDCWILKLDAAGNKQWDKTYGGTGSDGAGNILLTPDGGYVFGGSSDSGISGDKTQASKGATDIWLLKLDATGNKVWDKSFGGNSNEGLAAIKPTSDGGYMLGASSSSSSGGDKSQNSQGGQDFWLVKLDANFNKVWDKTIGSSGSDGLIGAEQTSDGGYVLAGEAYGGPSGDKSQNAKGDVDYWIVKLGAQISSTDEPQKDFAISIFPNPNRGKFNLQLSNLTSPFAEVTVSDILGRVVLQQQLSVKARQVSEQLEIPAAKGMYLLQLKTGGQTFTRKIVVE